MTDQQTSMSLSTVLAVLLNSVIAIMLVRLWLRLASGDLVPLVPSGLSVAL